MVLHIYRLLHLSIASVQVDFSLSPLRTHGQMHLLGWIRCTFQVKARLFQDWQTKQ